MASTDSSIVRTFLPTSAIALDALAPDWRSALHLAGALLVSTGCATDAYTNEMIQTIDAFGPYMVLAPGVALAHARPSPSVLKTGLSWVRLSAPVEFGHATNDPVGLVIGLAAVDKEQHRDALSAVGRALADAGRMARLQDATTPSAVVDILSEA